MPSAEFIRSMLYLKDMKRRGWLQSDVPTEHCESVAEHTYSTSLFTMLYALENQGIDMEKALKMALIHDLVEAKIGDITPTDGITPERKAELEMLSAESVFEYDELKCLFEEFMAGESTESKLVKQMDILDRTIQAIFYIKKYGETEKLRKFINLGFKNIHDHWAYSLFLKTLEAELVDNKAFSE